MMNQNGYYAQQPNYNGGYYGAPGVQFNARPQPKSTQPLTPEQAGQLRNKQSEFDYRVDATDSLRSICTHKDPTTLQNAIYQTPDGKMHCSICGEEFLIVDMDAEEVDKVINSTVNILQTIKTIHGDAPAQFIANFMQIIPLLKKIPALYKSAMQNFSMYEPGNQMNQVNPYGNNNAFTMLNQITNGPIGGGYAPMNYGMPQNAYGQPAYAQPMYNQAPQQAPYGYPQYDQQQAPQYVPQPQVPVQQMGGYNPNMNANPFCYNAPVMAQQQQQAPQQAPAAGVAPQQATAAGQNVQQTKSFDV
ncbi:MAG: hypothetical protein RSC68_17505 [Acinetobacter sp.]